LLVLTARAGANREAVMLHRVIRTTAAAVVVFAAVSGLARPASAQDILKVGAPLPLTGPLSPEGTKQKQGYDLWAATPTTKAASKAGGRTYKIEIVYVDYASNTPRAVQSQSG